MQGPATMTQRQAQSQSQNQAKEQQWPWPQGTAPFIDPATDDEGIHALTLDERIAAEAYRIAAERGFPLNAAVDHWLEAEKRITQHGSDSERL